MRLALAATILAGALPASAQTAATDPPQSQVSGRQSAKTAYGYRLTAPEQDDDPTDRRVLRRLNTRLNNRLETRIERYRFVDTKSDRTGTTTRNPYAPRPASDAAKTEPVLRKRPPEDR